MPDQEKQKRTYRFDLFADYFQFYLRDEQAINPDPFPNIWSKRAFADMLAVLPGIVNIRTVRNMFVPVTVEIADAPPHDEFDTWDHVVETSLDVPSGSIVIAGCTEYFPDAARIPVPTGNYRLRAYYGALNSVEKTMGLEGDDHYRIVLWPDAQRTSHVLKRWARPVAQG